MTALASEPLLDLSKIRRDQRLAAWKRAIPSIFPGLSLEHCPDTMARCSVQHTTLDRSEAWLVESSPVNVVYLPTQRQSSDREQFSLMLQLQGTTLVDQSARSCRLQPGSLSLVDNRHSFMLKVEEGVSFFIVWQLPRELALSHHPFLHNYTAYEFSNERQAVQLLRMTVLHALESTPHLKPQQQAVALNSCINLLGLLDRPDGMLIDDARRRINQALQIIGERFNHSSFGADDIAQSLGISRRQLDRLFQGELGLTVTARIWQHRLEHASALLKEPQHAHRSITDIALSSGFEDPAHFTRSFRKRFGCPPREWRTHTFRASA